MGNTSLCVALPEQSNSHSCGALYHGEQGYNIVPCTLIKNYETLCLFKATECPGIYKGIQLIKTLCLDL